MNFISIPRIPVKWRYAGILFLLPFMACQSGETTITRVENPPVIDGLLAAAPHFVVNTDTEPERWVATTRLGLPKDSLFLRAPSNMVAVGDSIYISEVFGHSIFAVGNDGYLNRKIGTQGKAPGEFNFVMGLDYNGSYIFVRESERVQVFTKKFEYVHSFFNHTTGMQDRFSVSSDYLFLECLGLDWLICPYSTSRPYAWIDPVKFLPVLDLPNQSGENGHLVTVSPGGEHIAVAYMGLPYIFIYDRQFRHSKTIRFEGKRVRNFNPVVAPPDGSPGDMEPGTRSFMTTIKFLNSRYLIVNSKGIYILDLYENEVAKKIVVRPISDMKNITPSDFLLHGDYLYVSSPWEEYVYGYVFELD